jgi:dienelactone hydrolase
MSPLRTRNLLWPFAFLVLCGGSAFAQVKSFPDLVRMYDHDRKAPLDVKEVSVEDRGGVKVHNFSYAGSGRGRVPAYLVVPAGRGRFAAVVFAPCCDGNRATFLEEALQLARMGAVSLLIDWNAEKRPEYRAKEAGPPRGAMGGADDRDELIKMVVEFRRGIDLLLSRADIDAKRIGFVGHSTGGRVASILAGVEKRIKAVVVMASQISATEAWRSNDNPRIVKLRESLPKEKFEQYLEAIAPVDAIHYVKYAAPTTLLLQFGRQDDSPNERQARLFFDVASEPKTFKLYDARHHLNDEARKDRIEWLTIQLRLRS